MQTQTKKDADTAATNLDVGTDIGQENFEIEDITDLNLYAPLDSLSLCSSTSSCSSCCS